MNTPHRLLVMAILCLSGGLIFTLPFLREVYYEPMRDAFDFERIDLPLDLVLREAERCGGIAVPCHPGRPTVGMCAHYQERGAVQGVRVVETRNGGSRQGEDDAAQALAEEFGYLGIGGSDAPLVSQIGRCATRFEEAIENEDDLVRALRSGKFEAIAWT